MSTTKQTNETLLGREVAYPARYDASILRALPRKQNGGRLNYLGRDYWRAYEFSWLGADGVPRVSIVDLEIPVESEFLVESKSLKLYLNGFYNEQFETVDKLKSILLQDLQRCLRSDELVISFHSTSDVELLGVEDVPGASLDQLVPLALDSEPDPRRLIADSSKSLGKELTVRTDLFRSLCPVTGQPDWASLWIELSGETPDLVGLQTYLLGYRNHQGFHEQCVEQIYTDLWSRLELRKLEVFGLFNRRGGIEICPFRSSCRAQAGQRVRSVRQ